MRLLIAAAFSACSAWAAEPPPPTHSLTISDEKGEYAWRPLTRASQNLRPAFKVGMLALTESFPYSYPILQRSPFAMGGLKLTHEGTVSAMAIATLGGVNLNSQRLVDDPLGLLGSPANYSEDRKQSQNQIVASYYVDVGKTFANANDWKGAFFAAFDQFAFVPIGASINLTGNSGITMIEANAGTAWLKRSGHHELFLFGDAVLEAGQTEPYRNNLDFNATPSGRLGAEYVFRHPHYRAITGIEFQTRRADVGVRPYAGIEGRKTSAFLAGEYRKSNSDFYPDSSTIAADVRRKITSNLEIGVNARHETEHYSLSPDPEHDSRVTAGLTWTPATDAVIRSAKSWGESHAKNYAADRQQQLQDSVSAPPTQAAIRDLIAASPTLMDFLKAFKPSRSLDVLAATAEFARLFNQYNYNDNEGSPPNLESVDQIYQRARRSYLTGAQDPILECKGSAQFTAYVAEQLGRQSEIPVEAAAVTMKVSDEKERQTDHTVAMVKTDEYGIVFVDWGRVTPTYTWNTEKALRLYQALGGQPTVFHQITDPSKGGRHVGYLFTEEGKLLVNSLTFHSESNMPSVSQALGDEPRGDRNTVERFKGLLQR